MMMFSFLKTNTKPPSDLLGRYIILGRLIFSMNKGSCLSERDIINLNGLFIDDGGLETEPYKEELRCIKTGLDIIDNTWYLIGIIRFLHFSNIQISDKYKFLVNLVNQSGMNLSDLDKAIQTCRKDKRYLYALSLSIQTKLAIS